MAKNLSNMMSVEQLRLKMNESGRARRPFVWGVDYECRHAFFLDDPLSRGDVLWNVRGRGNDSGLIPSAAVPGFSAISAISPERYAEMFATLRQGLMRGDSFLANLTVPTPVNCTASLRDIFLHSDASYRLLLGDCFVCFSPEPFVRIEGRAISTFPMKGTIDASLPDAGQRLMDNYKEACEHYTIVDLMRNDLNSVADDVRVKRFRYIETVNTATGAILQSSSEITGRLPEGRHRDFGDIILPLLPAGSITGAPKEATVKWIGRAETAPRGWYTGVFGFFDGEVMDTAVMIRCLQRDAEGKLCFHSGGGITVNSVAGEEYAEVLTKVYLPC